MNNPAPNTPRSSRFGRSAWLVLLAGFFAFGAMTAVVFLAEDGNAQIGGRDTLPILGVALAIGGVGFCWAMSLAIRALLSGERATLPLWLFNFCLLPPAAYAFAHWWDLPRHVRFDVSWVRASFIPAILPCVALACFTGVPLVRRLVRRIEKRRENKGKPAWTRRKRWVMGALMLAIYAAMLGTVLLPVPIFILGAMASRSTGKDKDQNWIVIHSPNLVRDAAESVLHRWNYRQQLHDWQLSLGYVSTERLQARVKDANLDVSVYALEGLAKHNARLAADTADGIAWDFAAQGKSGSPYMRALQSIVSRFGTREQRKNMLERAVSDPTYCLALYFFWNLAETERDEEFIPLLEKHLHGSAKDHEYALMVLTAWIPEERAAKLLKDSVDSNDTQVRDFALSSLCYIYGKCRGALSKTIFFYGIEHKDISVRIAAWESFCVREISTVSQVECLRKFVKMLDGTDLVQRRAAVECILFRLDIDELKYVDLFPNGLPIPELYAPADPTKPVEIGGAPLPETKVETEAFKKVRQASEKWLKDHDK